MLWGLVKVLAERKQQQESSKQQDTFYQSATRANVSIRLAIIINEIWQM